MQLRQNQSLIRHAIGSCFCCYTTVDSITKGHINDFVCRCRSLRLRDLAKTSTVAAVINGSTSMKENVNRCSYCSRQDTPTYSSTYLCSHLPTIPTISPLTCSSRWHLNHF